MSGHKKQHVHGHSKKVYLMSEIICTYWEIFDSSNKCAYDILAVIGYVLIADWYEEKRKSKSVT